MNHQLPKWANTWLVDNKGNFIAAHRVYSGESDMYFYYDRDGDPIDATFLDEIDQDSIAWVVIGLCAFVVLVFLWCL